MPSFAFIYTTDGVYKSQRFGFLYLIMYSIHKLFTILFNKPSQVFLCKEVICQAWENVNTPMTIRYRIYHIISNPIRFKRCNVLSKEVIMIISSKCVIFILRTYSQRQTVLTGGTFLPANIRFVMLTLI